MLITLLLVVFGVWIVDEVAADSSCWSQDCRCVVNYLLQQEYAGSVEYPDTLEYEDAIGIDNKRVSTNPLLILGPISETDVSLAILAASSCNVPLSVLSGGHSAAGYCLSDRGVTVNLREGLADVRLIPENETLIYVEAGALWQRVYEEASSTEYLPIGGGCTTVGTGFLLGGGWSFLSRSYGLGSDNIVSMRMALSNTKTVTYSGPRQAQVVEILVWSYRLFYRCISLDQSYS